MAEVYLGAMQILVNDMMLHSCVGKSGKLSAVSSWRDVRFDKQSADMLEFGPPDMWRDVSWLKWLMTCTPCDCKLLDLREVQSL